MSTLKLSQVVKIIKDPQLLLVGDLNRVMDLTI